MNPSDELIEKVIQWDLRKVFKAYNLFKQEYPELQEHYDTIREGVKLNFDIYFVIEGMYSVKEKNRSISVGGNRYNLVEFWNEIEARENLMKYNIIEKVDPDEILTARGAD